MVTFNPIVCMQVSLTCIKILPVLKKEYLNNNANNNRKFWNYACYKYIMPKLDNLDEAGS